MNLTDLLLLLFAGTAAGAVGSMLGVGGGMIIIPVLTSFFPFEFEQARATSLFAVIATSCGVAVATGKERFGNLRLSVILAVPTALAAFLNALLAYRTQASVLYLLFSGVLIVAALLMWRREPPENNYHESDGASPNSLDGIYYDPKLGREVMYKIRRVPSLFGVSAVAGGVSGLLGVGGGVFQVPAMSLLGEIPMRAATATSNFLLGVTAAASLPIYMSRGHVRPLESTAVVIGVFGGAFAGAAFAKKLHGTALRRLFTIILVILAIQMFRKGL
ncbi:MAG: sulfite exporter TauE/SafE family protein [Planctomycetota bacterium]